MKVILVISQHCKLFLVGYSFGQLGDQTQMLVGHFESAKLHNGIYS